jgi:hypothetical protein
MQVYQTKTDPLKGTDFHEVNKQAFSLYQKIKKKSKRKPYIRSSYFKKDKIFSACFWQHLFEKTNWRDRIRRLKYFPAAIDLIQNSKFEPKSKENPNKPGEILHRFSGITKSNHLFHVQVKDLPLSVVYKPRPKVFPLIYYQRLTL